MKHTSISSILLKIAYLYLLFSLNFQSWALSIFSLLWRRMTLHDLSCIISLPYPPPNAPFPFPHPLRIVITQFELEQYVFIAQMLSTADPCDIL